MQRAVNAKSVEAKQQQQKEKKKKKKKGEQQDAEIDSSRHNFKENHNNL